MGRVRSRSAVTTRGSPASRHPPRSRITIREVTRSDQLEVARTLFQEDRTWLAEHREVTDFGDEVLEHGLKYLDQEIAGLPGEFAPPTGALFVAFDGREGFGCAALRRQGPSSAEFKRLYIRASYRGGGIGRRLTRRALKKARELGYRTVLLDTIPTMVAAAAMYRSMGFRPTRRYWPHPVQDALFFEYPLVRRAGPRQRTRSRR